MSDYVECGHDFVCVVGPIMDRRTRNLLTIDVYRCMDCATALIYDQKDFFVSGTKEYHARLEKLREETSGDKRR